MKALQALQLLDITVCPHNRRGNSGLFLGQTSTVKPQSQHPAELKGPCQETFPLVLFELLKIQVLY